MSKKRVLYVDTTPHSANSANFTGSEVSFQINLEDCSTDEPLTPDERQPLNSTDAVFSLSSSSSIGRRQPTEMTSSTKNNQHPRVEFVGLTPVDAENDDCKVGIPSSTSGRYISRKDAHTNGPPSVGGATSAPRCVPRRSLLGRPINFRCHRRDARYRRLQAKAYNFLERPKDWRSISYHLLVFLMVFMCLLLSVFSTIDQYEEVAGTILYYLELMMVIWFMIEFLVRIWSAGCRSRYQQISGRLQFARRPLCIVDMVVITASIIILCLGTGGKVFATSALRGLRFFQILRMVRVDRRGGSWKLLGSVIWAHRQELFTTLYIGFLGLIFSSFIMYLAEKDKNPKKFGTYADALWWGVITLCTVGYGDTVPITWTGKLIAAFCAILGISFFALPAGILGSGFALKVQQQQRQKHLIRRKGPAAVLIQSLWRCYAADENSLSTATWKIHTKACRVLQPSGGQKSKNNSSFMSRLSTRRKDVGSGGAGNGGVGGGGGGHNPLSLSCSIPALHSPMLLSRSILRRTNQNHSTSSSGAAGDDKDLYSVENDRSRLSLNDFTGQHFFTINHKRLDYKDPEDDLEEGEGVTQLTDVHKRAIRSLRKIQFFVARRKFKEAFRPYDVKDVIEQYSAGNLDMLTRIKSLQCRLDVILGKVGSKKVDVYESKISLASRIVKIERQVDDIESKLDGFIELYKDHRNQQQQQQVMERMQRAEQAAAISDAQKLCNSDAGHGMGGGTRDRKYLSPSNDYNQDAVPSGWHLQVCSASAASTAAAAAAADNRHRSEPCTPIVRNPARPMHRNLSDLGPRMVRKRVTINESGQTERSSAEGLSLTSRLSEEFSRHEEETVSELSTFLPLSRRYLPKRLSIASEEEEEEGDEVDDVVSTPRNKTDSTASLGSDDVSKFNDDVFPAKEETLSSCDRVKNVLDDRIDVSVDRIDEKVDGINGATNQRQSSAANVVCPSRNLGILPSGEKMDHCQSSSRVLPSSETVISRET